MPLVEDSHHLPVDLLKQIVSTQEYTHLNKDKDEKGQTKVLKVVKDQKKGSNTKTEIKTTPMS